MKDINVEDIADLTDATDNVRVFCPVHDVYYECAGVPTQVSCAWARDRITDTSASKRSIRRFVITEKAPTRAFS